MDIALVKHTPMGRGKTSGVDKGGRPVSFIFVLSAGCKWQVMDKVSTVRCKRFDASAMDDFLYISDIFRDPTKRPCVVAGFSSGKGRAVLDKVSRCLV